MASTSSDKQKQQLTLAGCLLGVLVLLVLYNVQRFASAQARQKTSPPVAAVPKESVASPDTTPAAAPTAPPAAAPAVEVTNGEAVLHPESATFTQLKEKAKELRWGRDPFILDLAVGDAPTLQLEVSGIIHDSVHPEATYAIINQDVVRIGDTIRGIKVVDIQPNYVRLKKFNQEFSLYLYQENNPPSGNQ